MMGRKLRGRVATRMMIWRRQPKPQRPQQALQQHAPLPASGFDQGGRERERDRETETERQRQRDRDRETERQRDRETKRQTHIVCPPSTPPGGNRIVHSAVFLNK